MIVRLATGAVFLSCVCFSADAAPVTSLNRKPGLWSLEVEADGTKGPGVVKQCVDATTDARMMQMASQSGSENCSKQELTKDASGYSFHAECSMSGSKMVSRGRFTGDFESKYVGEVETTFNPPLFGKASSKTLITAQWQGPCPSDMKAGDMAMPNGMKLSLAQAEQSAKLASKVMKNPEVEKMLKQAMEQSPELQDAITRFGDMQK
jgi:hypothetical protein